MVQILLTLTIKFDKLPRIVVNCYLMHQSNLLPPEIQIYCECASFSAGDDNVNVCRVINN